MKQITRIEKLEKQMFWVLIIIGLTLLNDGMSYLIEVLQ